jgi:hypothetical protein
MEFVIVEFPDRREVLVDGISYGDNRDATDYRILQGPEGLHRFRLRGPDNYLPLWLTLDVTDTDPVSPLRVVFTKKV